ncbi:hypothetical protein ACIQRK_05875 [Streptomyces anulatus]
MNVVSEVAPRQPWVVLDVDRTLINTTAWYHACARPGPLLDAAHAAQFRDLNEQAFGPGATLSEEEFRHRTLDLMNRSSPGDWSAQRMEDAGYEIAATLRLYPEVVEYLRNLQYQQSPRPRLLFLSAGYQPFISGLLRGLLRKAFLGGLSYQVVGSTIRFDSGRCEPGEVIDGAGKHAVVSGLLRAGDEIELFADDSYHRDPVFDVVEESGGRTVRVVHEGRVDSSRSWREFLSTMPELKIQSMLTTGPWAYALADTEDIFTAYAQELDNLPPTDNGIGVGVMRRGQFDSALDGLCTLVADGPEDPDLLRRLVLSLVHADQDRILLRGRLFHLCAPPYLFPEPMTQRERWHEARRNSLECLRVLKDSGVLARWATLARPLRWIVMSVLDHVRNTATHALDVLARSSVTASAPDLLDGTAEQLVEDCHLAYWSGVFSTPQVEGAMRHPAWEQLSEAVDATSGTPFVMRELDDSQVVAVSALSLAKQLDDSGDWPAGLIDFQSGALDLGLAFRVIAGLTRPGRPPVGVVHMAYSSKGALRGLPDPVDMSFEHLLSRVPRHFHDRLGAWLDGAACVLLYDNNVTTFATLANVKRVLAGRATAPIRATVACVNYDNIVRWLRGMPGEALCGGWEDVLDLLPVADYVAAYATWGTSTKTLAMDRMYALPAPAPGAGPPAEPVGQDPLFKVCRVHNVFDLAAVVRAGANAIGVHAVSPREPTYSRSQERHAPTATARDRWPDLPLAHLETDGIRAMAKALPAGLRVVVVVEKVPPLGDWQRILTALGLPAASDLQLQCRVTRQEVDRLRSEVAGGLICAIGADQPDFAEYFRFLDTLLEPASDHVLVDHSKHQPDLIAGAPHHEAVEHRGDSAPLAAMSGNRVPVLVADDVAPEVLLERCRRFTAAGVRVAGCDTQNSVEADPTAQRFRPVVASAGGQTLIRKSPDRLARWAEALKQHEEPPTRRTANQRGEAT